MTKGQSIERELVGRAIDATDPEGASATFGTLVPHLTQSIGDITHADLLDALKRLWHEKHIALRKWDHQNQRFRDYQGEADDNAFFFSHDFRIKRTPFSRRFLELLAEPRPNRRGQKPDSENLVDKVTRVEIPQPRKANGSDSVFRTALATYMRRGGLGEGGTGKVHSVVDEDGREWAIKQLRKGLSGEKSRRFKNEIGFLRHKRHKNLIEVVDHGTLGQDEKAEPFYVMPLFPSTLRKEMETGIPADRVLSLYSQLLDGMEAAHAVGVWHRDLKPENVLYDPASNLLVVADFGIAHVAEPLLVTIVKTTVADRLANFQYAAPEQRMRGEVDHRADIYALGLILNEMFTGQIFQGTSAPAIGTVAPEFAYLDDIVDRMLRQKPDERPSTVRQVKTLIESKGTFAVALSTPANGGSLHNDQPSQALPVEAQPLSSSPQAAERNIWLSLQSVNDLSLHLFEHTSHELPNPITGLLISVSNHGLKNLYEIRVTITNARSFNEGHSRFREGFGMKPTTVSHLGALLAGDMSPEAWFSRINGDHLEVGDTRGMGRLAWPRGDKSERELWLLTLTIDSAQQPQKAIDITMGWTRGSGGPTIEVFWPDGYPETPTS